MARKLAAYAALSYFALAANVAGYLRAAPPGDGLGWVFAAAAGLTYTALYLAPVVLLAAALVPLRRPRLVAAVAVFGGALVQIWIFADRFLFRLYGFHLNGFVWNLVTTRGGLESLGGGGDSFASFAALALGFGLLQVALWLAASRTRLQDWLWPVRRRGPALALAALFLVLALGERVTYAVSYAVRRGSVLATADLFPFYLPTRARELMRAFGVAASDDPVALEAAAGALDYPLPRCIAARTPATTWCGWWPSRCAPTRSTPRSCPRRTAFAAHALRFLRHYSGGNDTRMGMFACSTACTAATGSRSWTRSGAAAADGRARAAGLPARGSSPAREFTYPEFDRTIFARRAARAAPRGRRGSRLGERPPQRRPSCSTS